MVRAAVSGQDGDARALGDGLRLALVAERREHRGRRTDEYEPGRVHGAREVGIFGQEAVSRVDELGSGLTGGGDDAVDRQVRLPRGGGADADRVVGFADER